MLEYARTYRAAPDAVRQKEWTAAVEKISKLRDELGLMNRAENKEDDYSAAVQPSTEGGVSGVVPIPEVSTGADALGDAGKIGRIRKKANAGG